MTWSPHVATNLVRQPIFRRLFLTSERNCGVRRFSLVVRFVGLGRNDIQATSRRLLIAPAAIAWIETCPSSIFGNVAPRYSAVVVGAVVAKEAPRLHSPARDNHGSAGDEATIACLRENVEALTKLIEELRRERRG